MKKKPKKGTIENPYYIKKSDVVAVAVVKAKHWFTHYIKSIFNTVLREEDFVVVRWSDFHDGEKSNIDGKETLGIFHTEKNAKIFFDAVPTWNE